MIFLVLSMILLILFGVRIAYALGISASLYIVFYTDISVLAVGQLITLGSDSIIMVALPFFLLAGELMNAGGITARLVRFAMALIGNVSGGLSFVVIFTNMIMAAVSGAAIASGAAVGSVMIPAMLKSGYNKGYAGAVNAAAATIGPVIPPSIGFIIFASVSNASIGKLFVAGTLPGILLGILLMILSFILSRIRKYPKGPKRNSKELFQSFKSAFWSLMMPVIIIGGIMSGIVTATEAGVLAVIYGLFISLFIYKSIRLQDLPLILHRTAKQTARIMLIIASAYAFGWIISREVDPELFITGFLSFSDQKWLFLLVVILIILLLGTVMEGGSIMIILTPLLLPILLKFNIDIVHFGVIFQLAIMVGLLTPPIGILLFVISGSGNISVNDILKEIWPFYIVLLLVLFLCAYIPEIPLFLVNILENRLK
ncbi:MAG: TRAP transporter large permease [Bacteroidetes bacterium]|nr:TRAP transporter large permease [Bacteroidota bacterium]MDA1120776.1 TRAP transporter large permease [Bacteroidota bacterium]